MNKTITATMAIALAGASAMAVSPLQDAPVPAASMPAFSTSARITPVAPAASEYETFFEGFEDRPEGFGLYYDEWLPDGWVDMSRSGLTVPEVGEPRHNLTWRVLSNDSRGNAPACNNYAYEGECFAFIMADAAYDGHYDLAYQDEWLISPTITPKHEDWLYFRLYYNAAWTIYDSKADIFNKRNNVLEVYVTVDNGKTWNKAWDLVDDEITPKWTEEMLRAELINWQKQDFTPIYVNLSAYEGKPVKVAFRYSGNMGHSMAIDNVAVGVPQPVAMYDLPAGAFKQGISPAAEYPSVPTLLMPFGHESVWTNRSESVLGCEWTYTDASGARTTTDNTDLTLPAYDYGTVADTPSLVGIFESRRSEPYFCAHSRIQAGGLLTGKDEAGNECDFGAGYYDIADPAHMIRVSSNYISFNPELNLAWETLLGVMPYSIDVTGFCNFYPSSPAPYGFDFADVLALIPDPVSAGAEMVMSVFLLDASGQPSEIAGQAVLSEFPTDPSNFVNLRFHFDVPVYVPAGRDIITLLTFTNNDNDTVVFGYVKTTSPNVGNSLLYLWAYDSESGGWYETFHNLNNFPLNDGYHFAGMLQSLGVAYSSLELIGGQSSVTIPKEGATMTFNVKGQYPGGISHMAVTDNGVFKPDWATYSIKEETDGSATVTVTAGPATSSTDEETALHIVVPGARVTIPVMREGDPAGIRDVVTSSAVSVRVSGSDIVIDGAEGVAEVFDAAGLCVASAHVSGHTVIPASSLARGIYLVRINGATYKIVK